VKLGESEWAVLLNDQEKKEGDILKLFMTEENPKKCGKGPDLRKGGLAREKGKGREVQRDLDR